MGQKKLIRFEEIKKFENVLEYPENMAGKWNSFFKNANGITLELACGKGEYAIGLAKLFPGKNFIGIDVKGNRIWRGAKTAIENNLKNVAFLRTQIDKISNYFSAEEIEEIWITFPDPQLRLSKIKKRLTHPKFLRFYQNFLMKGGAINLKTDSPQLYYFTKEIIRFYELELIADIDDVYNYTDRNEVLNIKTYYEGLDISKSSRVHYLKFLINKQLPFDKDELLKQSSQ